MRRAIGSGGGWSSIVARTNVLFATALSGLILVFGGLTILARHCQRRSLVLVSIRWTLRATCGRAYVFVTGGAKFTRSRRCIGLILKFTTVAIGANGGFTHKTFSSSTKSTGFRGR